METLIVLLILGATGYYLFKRFGGTATKRRSAPTVTLETSAYSTHSEPPADPKSLPKAWASESAEFLTLRLSDSVSVTLKGPIRAAQEAEQYLIETRGQRLRERAPRFAVLLSRLNIEVPEIEAFRMAVVSKVKRAAVAEISKTRDLAQLKLQDPELLKDLLVEAEAAAYENLDERPGRWRQLEELFVPRPDSLQGDDELLAKVNHDPNLLWVYSSAASDQAKARRVRDGESIEPWVALVDTGLAIRGVDIPAESLVQAFTMVELNKTLKPERPIRRKAAAVPLLDARAAAELPDIQRTFLVEPIEPRFVRAIEAFEWVRVQAALLLETVECAEISQLAMLKAPPGTRGALWSVYGDCCARARKLQDQDEAATRRPTRFPPYHIGCEAHVEVFVDEPL